MKVGLVARGDVPTVKKERDRRVQVEVHSPLRQPSRDLARVIQDDDRRPLAHSNFEGHETVAGGRAARGGCGRQWRPSIMLTPGHRVDAHKRCRTLPHHRPNSPIQLPHPPRLHMTP